MQACKTCNEKGLLGALEIILRIPPSQCQPRLTPQAQPTCTFNHARPRDIIASLTLLKQDRFRVYALGATQIPTLQRPLVAGGSSATLSHDSRRASRRRRIAMACSPCRSSLTISARIQLEYDAPVSSDYSCRASLRPVCCLPSAPLLPLRPTTSMILQRHNKSWPTRKQTAKPPAPYLFPVSEMQIQTLRHLRNLASI